MANTLSALNKEEWSREMQDILEKELVAIAIANTELRSLLNSGDTVHKPFRSNMKAQDYTKGTPVSIQDVSATDETLVVDTAKVVPFYVDAIDDIQNSYATMMDFARDAQHDLNEIIDGDILNTGRSAAASTVDDGNVGGTAGQPAQLTTSNVNQFFTAIGKKLNAQNVRTNNRFAVISPSILELLQLNTSVKDTNLGDSTLQNGFVGERYGLKLFLSNNLTSTAVLTTGGQPADGETISIAGVVFTYRTVLTPAAGEILIGASEADTLTNTATLLNDPATTTATGVAVSTADCITLEGISAVSDATTLTVTFEGGGEVDYTTDQGAWGAETVHVLGGRMGAIDCVIQKTPTVEFKQVPDQLGVNVLPWMLYGKKVFGDGAKRLVDAQADSSNF